MNNRKTEEKKPKTKQMKANYAWKLCPRRSPVRVWSRDSKYTFQKLTLLYKFNLLL